MRRYATLLSLFLLLTACSDLPADGGDGGSPDAGPTGLAVLGLGSHSPDSVETTVVATVDDGLIWPRDVAINPQTPSEAWIVNEDDAIVVVYDVGLPTRSAQRFRSFGSDHFLAHPSALAFGAPGTFATAQEEDEVTQPSTPADFMGPTLWTTAVGVFDGGHGGHLDMLHNSPNSAGIAWERDNVYWIFDGLHNSLTRYDFQADHGPGGADHSDGVVARCVEGQVSYVADVPSHMEMDRATGMLYVADTGNGRVAVLDTSTGTRGDLVWPNYDGTDQYAIVDAVLSTFVDGAPVGLTRPSGLAIRDGHVFVGDNATSRILAFDMTGQLVDYLDYSSVVPPGGLMGMDFDAAGNLLVVDHENEQILRIAPRAM